MNKKPAHVAISVRQSGVAFATVGEVRRVSDGRILHTTAPRPNGFGMAAAEDARKWALDQGYTHVNGVSEAWNL